MMEEQGSFVAPPLSGTAQGETNGVGFESGAIVLPELRLRLPRFELPSVFRTRQAARMFTEGGVAPWASQGQANAFAPQNEVILRQQVATLQNALSQSAPADAQTQAEAQAASQAAQAAQAELERLRCELNRLRQLEAAIGQAQQNMRDNPGCQNSQAESLPTPAPRCPDPRLCPPTPIPDENARRWQSTPVPPVLHSAPLKQPAPLTQPVSVPLEERAAMNPGLQPIRPPQHVSALASREVRPIAYAAPVSPAVSPDHIIRQPALLPIAGEPIREPARAPQGRILGVTPRR
jgi:hypothetical protein